MNSVKSLDINLLVVHGDKGVSKRHQTIVRILKGRTKQIGGKFSVTYNVSSDKLQGMEIDEVYIDDISGMGHK